MSAVKWRLLIAEPDPDVSRSLQVYFEAMGHDVRLSCQSGGQVVGAARQWQPHVVLVSAELQVDDPYAICQELMDDTLTGHIPVIMLLHLNERSSRLKALEAGADDIMTKPVDLEELKLRIEAAIRLSTL